MLNIKAFAGEVDMRKLDFYESIIIALENNKDIRAMKKALSATEREIGISRSSIMPKVRFFDGFTVTNNPIEAFGFKLNQTKAQSGDLAFGTLDYPGVVTNFLTSGIIEQTLYNKKAMIAIKMAKKEYSANGYVYLRRQEELIKKVSQAYIEIGKTQEFVEVAEIGLSEKKEHLRIAEFRYKNKGGLCSDVLRAKTEVVEAEQKLVTAKKNVDLAKGGLGMLLGREGGVEISNNTPTLQLNHIEYYNEFSNYRNDIKAMEIQVENAKNNIKLAQADWLPTLNAVASYNAYNSGYPFGAQGSNYIAAAFLKWDAFDGNKRKYETLKAKDKSLEAKEYLDGLKIQAKHEIGESYLNAQEAYKNYELAQGALKSAQDGAKMVLNRWQSSHSPFVDVLDAQTNLDRARENVVKNRNEVKTQIIDLYFDSGTIKNDLAIQ